MNRLRIWWTRRNTKTLVFVWGAYRFRVTTVHGKIKYIESWVKQGDDHSPSYPYSVWGVDVKDYL